MIETTRVDGDKIVMITTGWQRPVYILVNALIPGKPFGWDFQYKSGAVCYVDNTLALPEVAS